MQKNFEQALRIIAENPHGGDEFSGEGFRVRVSCVTSDGIVVHTIKTEEGTQTDRCTISEWRNAFILNPAR